MRASLGRYLLVMALVCAGTLVACSAPLPDVPAPPPPISAAHAKQLAAEHFNETFARKLNLKHPETGACTAVPEIRVEDFASSKLEGDTWLLERQVLIGFGFSIRVAKDGSWVAVQDFYVSTE